MSENSNRNKTISRIRKDGTRRREYIFYNRIHVFVKDFLPEEVNLQNVLNKVEQTLPSKFVTEVDAVYVGRFEHLEKREVTSVWADGAIYVTNEQDNEADMVDDIVHEIAHAVEDKYHQDIYYDQEIEQEFLAKREVLYRTISGNIPNDQNLDRSFYENPEFDQQFDYFLYNQIGYDKLDILTANMFYSPYGATSLREYFANGFEAFFLKGDAHHLKELSPKLYKKMVFLSDMETE